MDVIGLLAAYGAYLVAGVALAVAVAGLVYFFAVSRPDRYLDFLASAGPRADDDSDPDCRANLYVNRSRSAVSLRDEARRGSVQRDHGGPRVGRHDADRNPVLPDAAPVA